MKHLKKHTLLLLALLMFSASFVSAHAEESVDEEVIEEELTPIDEESVEIFDGMEIYPNLQGSDFREGYEGEMAPRMDLGDSMGGVGEEVTPEMFALPSGGPYVGYFNGKSTETINVWSSASGGYALTYVSMNGGSGVFGVLDHSGSRYKIAVAGVIGWVDQNYLRLHKFTPDTIQHNFYRVSGGDLEHLIPPSPTASNSSYSVLKQGKAPSYLGSGQYISFDGHYFYPATVAGYNTLIADYNAGHRNNSVNKNTPYYNYFQWLPARTQTTLTATDMRNYLKSRGHNSVSSSRLYETEQLFIDNGNVYGGNAALGFATGVHESGWGTSQFARERNNYFGHNAYDSSPGMASAYATPNFGIGIHFGRFWNWNYLNTHPSAYNNGAAVGDKSVGMNVKYASDPYWGEKIASHYYNMDKLAGYKDYQRYTLGVYTDRGVNVRKGPDSSKNDNIVYQNKLKGMPIAIIENKAGTNVSGSTTWYGFSADPMLTSNKDILDIGSLKNPSTVPYNFSTSTVYVHSSFIKVVSPGRNKGADSKLISQGNPKLEATPTVSKTSTAITAKGDQPLRPDPSEKRSAILTVPGGTKLTGYVTNNGYAQVLYKGQLGYIKTTAVPPTNKKGDINGDGKIDAIDMAMMQSHVRNIKKLSGNQFTAADINGDGKIDAIDMAMIQSHVRGIRKIKGW